ncbi:hypothetical protein AOA81_05070 [Methanomassiliicoccales archaeon RumEn M2]|nr:hypothetical protein AOA81_05070 [Methanomassiliicoccales archaeon RumEn M2]
MLPISRRGTAITKKSLILLQALRSTFCRFGEVISGSSIERLDGSYGRILLRSVATRSASRKRTNKIMNA